MSTPTSAPPPRQAVTLANFDALHDQHARLLLAYVAARVPAGTEAEDVCQDIWYKVSRHLTQHGSIEGQVRAWLFTIARNTLADLGDERRRPGLLPDNIQPADPHGDPIDRLLETARFEQLERCLDKLPSDTRELVRQKGLGKRASELATERNMKIEKIYRLVSQAYAILQTCMNEGDVALVWPSSKCRTSRWLGLPGWRAG